MSKTFYTAIDLNGNELKRARLQSVPGGVPNAAAGQVWFDPIMGKLVYGSAGGAIEPTSRAAHHGTQTASTISDLATVVRAVPLNEFAAPLADVQLDGHNLKGLPGINYGQPLQPDQAATVGDLLNNFGSMRYKAEAKVVATSNVNMATATVIDEVTLDFGMIALLTQQTDRSQNGLWRPFVPSSGGGAGDDRARGQVEFTAASLSAGTVFAVGDLMQIASHNLQGFAGQPADYRVTTLVENGPTHYVLNVEAVELGSFYEQAVDTEAPTVFTSHPGFATNVGGNVNVLGIFVSQEPAQGLIEFSLEAPGATFFEGDQWQLRGRDDEGNLLPTYNEYVVTGVLEQTGAADENNSSPYHYVLRVASVQLGARYSLPSDTETSAIATNHPEAVFYNPQNPSVNVYNDDGESGIHPPIDGSAGGSGAGSWIRADDLYFNKGELVYISSGGANPQTLWFYEGIDAALGGQTWSRVLTSSDTLNDLRAPTHAVDFNGQSITGVGAFTGDMTQAVNYQTLLNTAAQIAAQPLYKTAARLVATELLDAAVLSGSGSPTIDGQSLNDGDLVLLVAQGDGAASNGLWRVHQGSAWTRPLNPLTGAVATPADGELVYVRDGAANRHTTWQLLDAATNTWGPIGSASAQQTVVGVVIYDLDIGAPYAMQEGEGTEFPLPWPDKLVAVIGNSGGVHEIEHSLILLAGQNNSTENGVYRLVRGAQLAQNVSGSDTPYEYSFVRVSTPQHAGQSVYVRGGTYAEQTWRFESSSDVVNDYGSGTWKAVDSRGQSEILTAISVVSMATQSAVLLRQPVRVVARTNLTLHTAPPLVDGVQLEAGQWLLLAGQTDPTENGAYYLPDVEDDSESALGGVMQWRQRRNPALTYGDIFPTLLRGSIVSVAEGTYANTYWVLTGGAYLNPIQPGEAQAWSLLNGNRALQYGQQLAATISDFDARVRTSRLDQLAAPQSALSVGGQRVTDLAVPTANSDASTKAYADAREAAARAYADTLDAAGHSYADAGDAAARAYADSLDTATRALVATEIAGVSDNTLNEFGAPTAPLSIGGQRLTNVSAPTANSDAATKGYVDTGDAAARAYADTGDAAARAFATTGDDALRTELQSAITQIAERSLSDFGAPTADLSIGDHRLTDVATPVAGSDAATKLYTDTALSNLQSASLSSFGAPTAPLSFGGQRLTNLGSPVAGSDAVTRNYVEGLLSGIDWKQSARVASTGPLTLSGLQTVDGVALADGDRALVKNQANAAQNGIYVVRAGAWERAGDADGVNLTAGTTSTVTEGATQAHSVWRLIDADVITVGTTPLHFTEIGQLIGYTAGPGLKLVANEFSADYSLISRTAEFAVGDGLTSTVPLVHGFGKRGVQVQVYDLTSGDTIECDVSRTDLNTVTLSFDVAPAVGALSAVVVG